MFRANSNTRIMFNEQTLQYCFCYTLWLFDVNVKERPGDTGEFQPLFLQ